jgi:XisH protein
MAKDFYHNIVKNALLKDGWCITHDPYKIKIEEISYEIDLGAEPMIAAEKGGQTIAVEIKSFVGPSNINEFHRAIGQFIDYSIALEEEDPNRTLFLAVPESIYTTFFQKNIIRKAIERVKGKIIVYNPINQTIEKWIN